MIENVVGLYFSPAGNTAKITRKITKILSEKLDEICVDKISYEYLDLLKEPLEENITYGKETVVVIGMPVYMGRIPLVCVKFMQKLHANGAFTVVVVSYGNRSYGDALYELYTFADEQGFSVISAGAFVSQHAMFENIAAGRPDSQDMEKISEFSRISANKIIKLSGSEIDELRIKPAPLMIKGSKPVKKPMRIPVHPIAGSECTACGKCAEICPTQAISTTDPKKVNLKKCICCTACMHVCENGARGLFGPMTLASKAAMEILCSKRKEPEWFI